MAKRPSSREARRPKLDVLPNFCSAETLLRVFVMVGLLAVAVALLEGTDDPLASFAPILMFAFWVAFSSLLVLCAIQRWLARSSMFQQLLFPTLVPVLSAGLVHYGAEHFFAVNPEGRWRVITVAALIGLLVSRYLYLLAAWRQENRLVAQAREQALRARVRPHFLFNSMNSIASLCRSDPARAEVVALDMADLFRATFAAAPMHSLSEELHLARAYLDVEQTRFADRLKIDWELSGVEDLDLQVPSLFLQPLVENAVQHGIAPTRQGGSVWVRVNRGRHTVRIVIGNTVVDPSVDGTHTAGSEVRARLRQCFNERARVSIKNGKGSFEVDLILPLESHLNDERP